MPTQGGKNAVKACMFSGKFLIACPIKPFGPSGPVVSPSKK